MHSSCKIGSDPARMLQSRSPGRSLAIGILLLPLLGISECAGTDADGDGHDTSTDCDDSDPSRYPGAPELCDGRDQDCDRLVDEELDMGPWQPDLDGDDFGDAEAAVRTCSPPTGWVIAGGDCDDRDATMFPGAAEISGDGIDSDCGGFDEADPSVGLSFSQFNSVQDVLNAAKDDPSQRVWVGPGIWFGAELSFGGKALQLKSTHGQTLTTIDADWIGSVIVFDQGEGPDTVLEGFTLSGGFANSTCFDWGCKYAGGGILIHAASPTLKALTLSDNRASYGAGLLAYDSSLTAQYLRVTENHSDYNGGGMMVWGAGAVRITDSVISRNVADQSTGGLSFGATSGTLERLLILENSAVYGEGGIHLGGEQSSITLSDSVIASNSSVTVAGGGSIDQKSGSAVSLHRVRISSNTAGDYAGGLLVSGSPDPVLLSFVELDNNTAGTEGGAIRAYGDLLFSQVRMTGNYAGQMGGATSVRYGSIVAHHAVITGNTAPAGGGIHLDNGDLDLDHSIVAYNEGGNLYRYSADPGLSYVTLMASSLYNPPTFGTDNQPVSGDYVAEEPGFLAYADAYGNACTPGASTTCLPEDLHLSSVSSLVNVGSVSSPDVDGSPADPGLYGGPAGASWDRDQDGLPDWFWPGDCNAAPTGWTPQSFDSNDADSDRRQCDG